jgi:DNA invertase Pin-like site-specific DNA recombinase
MIAAIYARKSTDQNVSDEEKSVGRQAERATAYAHAKGWTVATEQIYSDDGISGAGFVKRPGFLRLMNALKPRPPFQVLIMSEESRLGREQIETAYALKQITDAGVRVFFYLEDRERTLDSAMDKVMLSLTNFAAKMEREKARQRTYDAIRRKAERHHVAGGMVYGYDNVEILSAAPGPDGKPRREHVVELRTLDAEIAGLEGQLAAGAPWSLIQAPLEARRRRREALAAQLAGWVHASASAADLDLERHRQDAVARLTDWQGLLERQPIQGRQILRKLFPDRLAFHPFDDHRGIGYEIRGQAAYGGLLAGVCSVLPPAGLEQSWSEPLPVTLHGRVMSGSAK